MTYGSVVALLLVVVSGPAEAESGIVDYLTGAELQCEESQIPWVSTALMRILSSDPDELEEALFPSYGGDWTWTLERFITAYFVPDHAGAVPGEDLFPAIASPEARSLLRSFYAELGPSMTWARIES